jgi:MFS family permease
MVTTEDRAGHEAVSRDRSGLFAFWAANGISMLGGAMTTLAVPWFIFETTGSAARTGLVGTALAVGGMLSPVLSGPLIDRLGFKRASVLADVAAACLVATIPLLHAADMLAFWHILVLAFLIQGVNGPGDAARYSLVPGLAHRARMAMERANAVDRGVGRATMLIGPLVGGVLIAVLGPANVLLLDALTFVASAVLVSVFVRPSGHEKGRLAAAPRPRGAYRAELFVGLRFVFASSLLLSVAVLVSLANALDAALQLVVLPVYATEMWGTPTSLGALTSALGAGALIGTAIFGAIGHRMPRRLTVLLGGAGGSLLLFGGLATTPPLGVMVILAVIGGIVAGPIVPLLFTVVQTHTPPDLYGRVFGALQSLTAAAPAVSMTVVGLVIEGLGLVPTIVALGALYLVLTLGMLLNPALRRMDADRPADQPVATP